MSSALTKGPTSSQSDLPSNQRRKVASSQSNPPTTQKRRTVKKPTSLKHETLSHQPKPTPLTAGSKLSVCNWYSRTRLYRCNLNDCAYTKTSHGKRFSHGYQSWYKFPTPLPLPIFSKPVFIIMVITSYFVPVYRFPTGRFWCTMVSQVPTRDCGKPQMFGCAGRLECNCLAFLARYRQTWQWTRRRCLRCSSGWSLPSLQWVGVWSGELLVPYHSSGV